MFSLSMTFYLFPMAFRSWGSVERGPTYFTCLLKIPVHYHSDIYSPILPHEEGYGIQAFSRYLCLVQQKRQTNARTQSPVVHKVLAANFQSVVAFKKMGMHEFQRC